MAEQNKVDRSKMTVSDEVVVSMDAVNKWYGSFHVLRDINLEVNKGERIVICGPDAPARSEGELGRGGRELPRARLRV